MRSNISGLTLSQMDEDIIKGIVSVLNEDEKI